MEQAFTALRRHARSRQLRLSDLAQGFITGTDPLDDLVI
jgi:AmiR/NasT family two-component response regulator